MRERDLAGRVTRFRDGGGHEWIQAYDANGRPEVLTGPDQVRITRAYTRGGKVASVTTVGRGGSPTLRVEYRYDRHGQLERTITPSGEQSVARDAIGRVTAVTANGATTATQYDSRGRVSSVTDANGDRVQYRYDATTARLDRIIDARGRATVFGYDTYNRVIRQTAPSGLGDEIVSFWPSGEPKRLRDRAGRFSERSYDDAGRLARVDFIGSGEAIVYAYAFSANGSEITETFTSGAGSESIARSFDRRGRLVTLRMGGETVNFTYRDDDRILTKGHLRFDYDARGYLTSVTDTGSVNNERVSLLYDALGRVQIADLPLGIRRQVADDDLGRLASVQVGTAATSDRWDLSYDQQSRIRKIQGAGRRQLFAYDAGGRLRSETADDAESSVQSVYAYDANGNRTRAMEYRPNLITEAVDLRSATLPAGTTLVEPTWTPSLAGVSGARTTPRAARLALTIPASAVLNVELDLDDSGLAAGEAVRAGVALWPSASGDIAVVAETRLAVSGSAPLQLRAQIWCRPADPAAAPVLLGESQGVAHAGGPILLALQTMADGTVAAQAWDGSVDAATVSIDVGNPGGAGRMLIVDGERAGVAPAA
ncbi:MAG: RHS repeat protein, partial [Planctomycetes bacterium]|nr:RHS repeat protein [Planctomycetota bacterium]